MSSPPAQPCDCTSSSSPSASSGSAIRSCAFPARVQAIEWRFPVPASGARSRPRTSFMKSARYVDVHDRPIPLGEKTLGSGGEGVIHTVLDAPQLAAKIYKPNARRDPAKLRWMAEHAAPSLRTRAALPLATV